MRPLLEQYDRATEEETRERAAAESTRELRESLLYVLHRDGATLREIVAWTGLSLAMVQRMVRRGRVRYQVLIGE